MTLSRTATTSDRHNVGSRLHCSFVESAIRPDFNKSVLDNAQLRERHVPCVRRQTEVHVRVPRRVVTRLREQGVRRGARPNRVAGMVPAVRLPEQHHVGVYERSRPEVTNTDTAEYVL